MMAPIEVAGFAQTVGTLPPHGEVASGATPGHPFFGAMFVFIGSLLVAETLAGGVWRRERLLVMLWPGALIVAGLGMVLVSYVQPDAKNLHLTLAVLLLLGGLFEMRYRLGQIPRSTADMVAIPALVLGGLVIGPMHANGPMSSVAAQMHVLVGMMGFLLAGIRLTQVRLGSPATLETGFGVGVMLLGLSLLLVQQFHAGH